MPRGGHARVGPVMLTPEERKIRGSETRKKHRLAEAARLAQEAAEASASTGLDVPPATAPGVSSGSSDDKPLIGTGCEPPEGLSASELKFWHYYAPKLKAVKRLTMVARDCLAKYCTALAVVSELRLELADKKLGQKERSAARRELRQYLNVTRLYESDLILNPATAVRQPGFDIPPPVDSPTKDDHFDDEFDDDTSSIN